MLRQKNSENPFDFQTEILGEFILSPFKYYVITNCRFHNEYWINFISTIRKFTKPYTKLNVIKKNWMPGMKPSQLPKNLIILPLWNFHYLPFRKKNFEIIRYFVNVFIISPIANKYSSSFFKQKTFPKKLLNIISYCYGLQLTPITIIFIVTKFHFKES